MVSLQQLIADATAQITRWEPAAACELAGAGGLIIDIREGLHRERDGVVPASVHIPLTKLEWRVAEDSEWRNPYVGGVEQPLILMCDGGYSSTLAAAQLVRLGFSRAGDVIGGFAGWAAAGLPVLDAPRRPAEADALPGMGAPVDVPDTPS